MFVFKATLKGIFKNWLKFLKGNYIVRVIRERERDDSWMSNT